MALDADFVQTARHYFNPYTPSSGTEHVAVLLYALARMTRPQVVVEYGSGYSTLWLLKALAENRRDADEERDQGHAHARQKQTGSDGPSLSPPRRATPFRLHPSSSSGLAVGGSRRDR